MKIYAFENFIPNLIDVIQLLKFDSNILSINPSSLHQKNYVIIRCFIFVLTLFFFFLIRLSSL